MKYTMLVYAVLLLLAFLMSGCGSYAVEVPGQNGKDGVAGPKGDTGATGPQGVQGPAGTNATPVTVVPLCPGVPVYGAVYVEDALCINNKLYGVYSANGGFLTYLPSGAYTSNGLGSACNFTVTNCTIKPN